MPALGVNVTWQLLLGGAAPAAVRAQLPELPNTPVVGPDVNVTSPVGATIAPAAVSCTVTVQVAWVPVVRGDGRHESPDDVWSAANAVAGAVSEARQSPSAATGAASAAGKRCRGCID
jgi:hypothetical protein